MLSWGCPAAGSRFGGNDGGAPGYAGGAGCPVAPGLPVGCLGLPVGFLGLEKTVFRSFPVKSGRLRLAEVAGGLGVPPLAGGLWLHGQGPPLG